LTGTGAVNGTGNNKDNRITGNSAANKLSGGEGNDVLIGGVGADTMNGGNGVDTYYVDNIGDVVVETGATADQQDYIHSTISYSLANLSQVEQLVLVQGSKALNATGNGLNNHLFGNSLDNVLDGKAGGDFMRGEGGNDTYIVDDALGDLVVEAVGGGTDTVRSSVSFTLSANVEKLVLTGSENGLIGTGNDLKNYIVGNDGSNTLNGGEGEDTLNGGLGNDTLIGGADRDRFVISAGGGHDVINGFEVSWDRIDVRGLFSTWDELLASATTVTDDVVIQITASDSLTVKGFTKDSLVQADFLI
jgi:Ca2+-binding RTX toxin-like protein